MAPFGKDAPSPAPDTKHPGGITVIARETRLVGEVTGSRGMRIEGTVHGKIDLRAPVEIAEAAVVEAEIHGTSVRVAGSVTGNIVASEVVELLATAKVKGDVTTPALHVVEGAKLEGRVQMRTDAAGKASPAVVAPDSGKAR